MLCVIDMCFSQVQSKKCSLRRSSIWCKIEKSASVIKLKQAIKICFFIPASPQWLCFNFPAHESWFLLMGWCLLWVAPEKEWGSQSYPFQRIPELPFSIKEMLWPPGHWWSADCFKFCRAPHLLCCCGSHKVWQTSNVTKGFMCNA